MSYGQDKVDVRYIFIIKTFDYISQHLSSNNEVLVVDLVNIFNVFIIISPTLLSWHGEGS